MIGLLVFLIFILFLIPIGVGVFTIVCNWLIFKKAGKEGWEAIVPIYNTVVLIEITGLPMWYIALFFLPLANIYASIKIYLELASRFKQSVGFGIGLFFLTPIFLGILAFDKKMVYELSTNIYCNSCGTKLANTDKFCVRCGKQI